MKKLLVFLCVMALIIAMTPAAEALTVVDGMISDDFNDGNADGWVFPYYSGQSQGPGIWNVENGTLVQRFAGDNNRGLVDNLLTSNQVIEIQLSTLGYAGVVLWHQDTYYVAINFHTGYGKIIVHETIDGTGNDYFYNDYWIDSRSYDLRVDADSTSGELAIYVNDTHIFNYQTSTPYRSGMSGLWSGNEVGYFDNFRLTSNDIASIPDASIMLLLGSSLMGLAVFRRKSKRS